MATSQQTVEFYRSPGAMTSAGRHAALLEALPSDVAALARIVQGLAVHEYVASDFYGVAIAQQRKDEAHIRPVEAMLDRLLEIDPQPLQVARPAERRLVGVCHHYAQLLVTMLRFTGVAARARWGFGAYFNPGHYEDHVLTEYWHAAQARWVRVDAQLDDVWREKLKLDFDPLDVPHDRFLIAGDAWTQCRAGQADPFKFGIFVGEQRGLWFIACNLVKDIAALNKMEMLPWDVWGAMPQPNELLQDEQLAVFDRLAALTRAPDASFDELRVLYEKDPRLHVPATVFNAMRKRAETI